MTLLAVNMRITFWIVAAVLAAGLAVYGGFRRSSRMSWVSAETLAAFGVALPFTLIPYPSPVVGYVAVVLALLGGGAAALAVSGTVRSALRRRIKKTTGGRRAADIVLGILLGVGEGLLAAFVLFGAMLSFTQAFTDTPPAFFAEGIASGAYRAAGKYALDVLLVFLLVLSLKGGFKLGFGKYLWVGITLSLSFVAVFGALILVLDVPFLSAFAAKIAATMGYLHPIAARTVGVFVAAFLIFLLFFAVIVVLTVFINKLFVKINRSRPANIISGILQAAILFFITVAIFTGIGVGIDALLKAATAQEALAPVIGALERFLSAVCRSPVSALFHNSNPVAPFLP